MIFIAAFGLLMMGLSTIMIINPGKWAQGIVDFSRKSYFHWFEVFSRLIAGVIFSVYASDTSYPYLINGIGYLLMLVSLGLVITGPAKHRAFAVWSAKKFKGSFRPSGLASFCFGGFLIYLSLF